MNINIYAKPKKANYISMTRRNHIKAQTAEIGLRKHKNTLK